MAELKKIMISLPETLLEEIDRFAKTENETRSGLLRKSVKEYMANSRNKIINQQLRDGYIELGSLNLSLAREAIEADNLTLKMYEENLSESE